MVFKRIVRILIAGFRKLEKWSSEEQKTLFAEAVVEREKTIANIWDFLQFADNTQAFHLANVLSFEEWIDMVEIRRRIQEIFSISYMNERSLYPYLKTLVDLGLVETTNVGGRRKWRKKDFLIKLPEPKKNKAEITAREK